MKVLILAECDQQKVLPISYELLTRAKALVPEEEIGALLLGAGLPRQEYEKFSSAGVARLIVYESEQLLRFRAEPYSAILQACVAEFKPEIVLGGATSCGRSWLPYAAMKMHAGLTADCTELGIEEKTGLLLQTRPAIGGNIMATIKTPKHRPQMATIRPRSTAAAEPGSWSGGQIELRQPPPAWLESSLQELGFEAVDESRELSAARKVVVVGRGLKRPENLPMVEELAGLLGAALGATREVVDRGWLPYSCQIGLSGRTITPELYLGLGVSGAIQHLAGMQTAKRIVAVNSDPEAQLFSLADLSLVGNMQEVLPVLISELKRGGQI
ncbi:MAG: electron transfer flavoprotein subunit alpha/FixB family protein [Lentisphaeria bacterium]|jgi:electron transfer flavoprotein alpha subunit|nr:electron transfer flavoprotein subunit alpha/FixB family protein [Lentisphaeria bacterium]MDY0176240.1 electron transfer flavoprotein subunit alpha/FixB family protein [Lentisphaeria bacterium]NLZ60571.1 electron transfer flavoprotein subunit alpha/FixB family protein [Lentisphaerota bacterium]